MELIQENAILRSELLRDALSALYDCIDLGEKCFSDKELRDINSLMEKVENIKQVRLYVIKRSKI